MRIRLGLLVLVLLPTTAALAASWPGRPTSRPPKLQQAGPPPAWIETHTTSTWLAYSTYCWKTTCVDFIPPASRSGLPVVRIVRGAKVRVHFALQPTEVYVALVQGSGGKRYKLPNARVVTWQPPASGIADFEIRAAGGSASYVARLRLR